ncbi:hypothetical protein HYQ46_010131 [Verticillium longisporum]|nr:hypothetical protein HYQ46_010131 [Verticillium longisporum]
MSLRRKRSLWLRAPLIFESSPRGEEALRLVPDIWSSIESKRIGSSMRSLFNDEVSEISMSSASWLPCVDASSLLILRDL